jgi:CheY-like chemotaxis protein
MRPGDNFLDSKAVILCVDDEPNNLTLRALVLERAGYEVSSAESADAALSLLASRPVDLVLSDQLMPHKTGTQLARDIKAKWPTMPVIIISGVNERPDDADIADLFMSKVEGPVRMCENIQEMLSKYQSGRATATGQ